MQTLKVAILGTGLIGTDLLIKVLRSPHLICTAFVGRNLLSAGMLKAQSLGVPVSAEGIEYFIAHPECCDLVFDCTSAKGHKEHAHVFKTLNIMAVDLTPSNMGGMCVPGVNLKDSLMHTNVNMVTCGGQASIPLAYVMGTVYQDIEYMEVVSNIASKSAGPATRLNLDEYIHTTEKGLKLFSGAHKTKAILNLNPANPCINMQTTVFAKIKQAPHLDVLQAALHAMVKKIQTYVPGYEMIVGPLLEDDRIVVMVRVKGLGDYLPAYAGNLDIINCAAIAMAEAYAKVFQREMVPS